MGLWNKTIEKAATTVAKAGNKIIKNSATGDKQNARTYNKGEGWLSDNIHELMILFIFFAVLFAPQIGVAAAIQKELVQYLGLIIAFLFGRPRR